MAEAEDASRGHHKIVFGSAAGAPIEDTKSELYIERERHRMRSEKFGTAFVDPAARPELRELGRRERLARPGFATGIDVFSREEVEKRAARAARFGAPTTNLDHAPPTLPEDEARRKQRAERFGGEYSAPDDSGLMDLDLAGRRREVPPGASRRREAVHVFGVDVLSTRDILSYFADYGPTFVEWIDDSSCNVLFADAASAARAVAGKGSPILAGLDDAAAEGGGGDEAEGGGDPSTASLLRYWYKGPDARKGGTQVPLVFRVAADTDRKPQGEGKQASRRLWTSTGARGPGGGGGRRDGGARGGPGGGGGGGGGAGGGPRKGAAIPPAGGKKIRGRGHVMAVDAPRHRLGSKGGVAKKERRRRGDVEMGEAEVWAAGGAPGAGAATAPPPRDLTSYADL